MKERNLVVLSTLNSSFIHAAFGLRYIYANLAELQNKTRIIEFTINQSPDQIVAEIGAQKPRVVGFGVYIWNTRETERVVRLLRQKHPEIVIVLGGPEVSYEIEHQTICDLADYVVPGEADFLFRELCQKILSGDLPPLKIFRGELPEVKALVLPYAYYSAADLAHRVLYVEASRGCPYKCEYCLSSLDKNVRNIPLDAFLSEMNCLIERGARQFKFVDRTFNLSVGTSTQILEFFLTKVSLGIFLHFEMVPDRLPEELKSLIKCFPRGSLQFEIGVQTWNPEVSARVSRRQNYAKVAENFRFLREETGVHTHADLIAGLPGEDWESFARGFDALAGLEPDEIQLGILKRLRGTPIVRHDATWEMRYDEVAPYAIRSTKVLTEAEIVRLERLARYWNLIANSGNFVLFMRALRQSWLEGEFPSLFGVFSQMEAFLFQRFHAAHGIHLVDLFAAVLHFAVQSLDWPLERTRALLAEDYAAGGTRKLPEFLWHPGSTALPNRRKVPIPETIQPLSKGNTPSRQARHIR